MRAESEKEEDIGGEGQQHRPTNHSDIPHLIHPFSPSTMASEAAEHTTGGEEHKDQLQTKDRVCDYYISARGCIKVHHTPHPTPPLPLELPTLSAL